MSVTESIGDLKGNEGEICPLEILQQRPASVESVTVIKRCYGASGAEVETTVRFRDSSQGSA